jgi:hypothetical protein
VERGRLSSRVAQTAKDVTLALLSPKLWFGSAGRLNGVLRRASQRQDDKRWLLELSAS